MGKRGKVTECLALSLFGVFVLPACRETTLFLGQQPSLDFSVSIPELPNLGADYYAVDALEIFASKLKDLPGRADLIKACRDMSARFDPSSSIWVVERMDVGQHARYALWIVGYKESQIEVFAGGPWKVEGIMTTGSFGSTIFQRVEWDNSDDSRLFDVLSMEIRKANLVSARLGMSHCGHCQAFLVQIFSPATKDAREFLFYGFPDDQFDRLTPSEAQNVIPAELTISQWKVVSDLLRALHILGSS